MRPLLELFVVGMVVFAGWHQPFRDHAAALFPNAGIQPSRTAILAQRAARLEAEKSNPAQQQTYPRSGSPANSPSWMWNETSLDRPYKSNGNVSR